MARPNKIGLDYFPLDVDIFEDEKISAISGEFGIKGEITVIKLLCAIYRNGYFILWNDLLKFKLLRNLPGVSSELIESIVNRLVLWEFFDKALFDSVKVLTSRGIQKRYFEASKRRKAAGDLPYLLIEEVCGCVDKDIHSSVDGIKDARSNVSDCGVNVNNNSSSGDVETSSTNGEHPENLINVYNNRVNVYNNPVSDDINASKNTTKKRKEKKINIPPIIPPLGIDPDYGDEILPMEKLKSEIPVSQSIWLEQIAMLRHLTPNALNAKLDEFFDYLTVRGKTELSVKNFKNYFGNWLDKGLKNKKEEDNGTITW